MAIDHSNTQQPPSTANKSTNKEMATAPLHRCVISVYNKIKFWSLALVFKFDPNPKKWVFKYLS